MNDRDGGMKATVTQDFLACHQKTRRLPSRRAEQQGTGGAKSGNSYGGELTVTDRENRAITVPAKDFEFTGGEDN